MLDFIKKVSQFLNGKKTYIIAIGSASLGLCQAMNWFTVPTEIWPLIGAIGLGTLRSGVNKVAEDIKNNN